MISFSFILFFYIVLEKKPFIKLIYWTELFAGFKLVSMQISQTLSY